MNTKAFEELKKIDTEIKLLEHINATLSWDQETYMPALAIEERSEQVAYIGALSHEKSISKRIDELLTSLGSTSSNPSGDESLAVIDRAYLRVMRQNYDKKTKLPTTLVTELNKEASLSQASWREAKEKNDFASFAPRLEKMIALQKEIASCYDSSKPAYDVLLDLYEKDATEESVGKVFADLRNSLVQLLDKIKSKPQIDDSFLHTHCPISVQEKLSHYLMSVMDYSEKKGRIDVVEHPFTTTLGSDDVRITTHYDEEFFPSSMFSTIHESGHALYELNLLPAASYRRTSLSEATSMAVHESQSRLWENIIGRSRGFWMNHLPATKKILSPILDNVELDDYYRAINKVEPSLIRTEADEVTYSLHIILRFELEAQLISGNLSVKDLPYAWNNSMKEFLGIVPKNDSQGCLQDVHWSIGYFGYFPSYALGNLYGAQWLDTMKEQGLCSDTLIESGNLNTIRNWFAENVHKKGSIYSPKELIKNTSGKELDASHFVNYLNKKYSGVYGF